MSELGDFCMALCELFLGLVLTVASLGVIVAAPILAFPSGFVAWIPGAIFLLCGVAFITAGIEDL